jgi:hypothetical protein
MKTDKPFQKSFACAAALFVFLAAAVALIRAQDRVHAIVVAAAVCCTIALISGGLGYLSRKPWSWVRFATTVMGLFLVYVFGLQFVRHLMVSAGPR